MKLYQSGILLGWVTSPCTRPSGYVHLKKWLSGTCTSKVYQISNFSERHLHKWHMPALSQVVFQTVYSQVLSSLIEAVVRKPCDAHPRTKIGGVTPSSIHVSENGLLCWIQWCNLFIKLENKWGKLDWVVSVGFMLITYDEASLTFCHGMKLESLF